MEVLSLWHYSQIHKPLHPPRIQSCQLFFSFLRTQFDLPIPPRMQSCQLSFIPVPVPFVAVCLHNHKLFKKNVPLGHYKLTDWPMHPPRIQSCQLSFIQIAVTFVAECLHSHKLSKNIPSDIIHKQIDLHTFLEYKAASCTSHFCSWMPPKL